MRPNLPRKAARYHHSSSAGAGMLPLLASYCPALPPRDGPRHFNFLSESGLIAGCGSAVPADSGQGQCSGHGVCVRDATHTSQGTCKCNAPWKGRYCDFVECPSYGCAAARVYCPGCEPAPHLLEPCAHPIGTGQPSARGAAGAGSTARKQHVTATPATLAWTARSSWAVTLGPAACRARDRASACLASAAATQATAASAASTTCSALPMRWAGHAAAAASVWRTRACARRNSSGQRVRRWTPQ